MSKHQPHKSFGFVEFLWRLLAALALVLASYNPAGFSYFHWVRHALTADGLGAIHFFVAAIILIGWTVFLIATSRSLGLLGTVLGAALVGTALWLLTDIGLIRAHSATAFAWLALIAIAVLLAIGLSWAHIWRRLSGQLEVDETDA